MNSDQELIAQAKLALSIISRRHAPILTVSEAKLLRIDGYTPTTEGWKEAQQAAEETLLEILLAALPDKPAPTVFDPFLVTAALLEQIEATPEGLLPYEQITVPDDLIEKMIADRVVRRIRLGLVAGSAADEFREMIKARYGHG